MPIAVSYPHIVKEGSEPARLERYPRIRVAMIVMDYLARGRSPEEMCRQYPHLTMSDVHAAMLYYWDHPEEIDREIQGEMDELAREEAARVPSPFRLRLQALKDGERSPL